MLVQLAERHPNVGTPYPALPSYEVLADSNRGKITQLLTLALDSQADVVIFSAGALSSTLFPTIGSFSHELAIIAPCGPMEDQGPEVLSALGVTPSDKTPISGELALVSDGNGVLTLRTMAGLEVNLRGLLIRHVSSSDELSLYDVHRREQAADSPGPIRENMLSISLTRPSSNETSISLNDQANKPRTIKLPAYVENFCIVDVGEARTIPTWGTILYNGRDSELANSARDLNSSGVPRALKLIDTSNAANLSERTAQCSNYQ